MVTAQLDYWTGKIKQIQRDEMVNFAAYIGPCVPAWFRRSVGAPLSMSLLKTTIKLAAPAVSESLLSSAIFLIDALMIARVGTPELAAAALAGVVMWRLRSMAGALQIGAGAAVARRWGEGNFLAASTVFSHTAMLAFLIGLCCLVFYPFMPWVFQVLQAEGEVLPLAAAYFQVLLIAFPMRLASVNMAATIRAAGDTTTPMLVTMMAILLNVLLNTVFIFGWYGGPEWGLWGAGLATALAFVAEFVTLCLVGYFGTRMLPVVGGPKLSGFSRDDIQVEREESPEAGRLNFVRNGWRPFLPGITSPVLRVSIPSFWEEVAVSIGFLGFIAMIAHFGEEALAAHACVVRVESFSFQAGFGFTIAAATIVGQSLGRGAVDVARRAFVLCVMLAVIVMGFFGFLYIVWPGFFLSWFNIDIETNIGAIGAMLFVLAGVQQPWLGATMVLSGGLRGAGETTSPLVAQLIGTIGVRLGVGYFLGYTMGMGVVGVYWGTVVDWLLRCIVLGWMTWKGKWERVQL